MKQVRLKKPHTHAGQKLGPGSTIALNDDRAADWLVTQGVAEFVDPNARVAAYRPAPVRPSSGTSLYSCCGRK